MATINKAWTKDVMNIATKLNSNIENGLTSDEVTKKQASDVKNTIIKTRDLTFWDIFLEEIKEPLILLLIVIGVIYSIFGDIGDAIIIFSIIVITSLVEVFTEYKAKKSIESLKKLSNPLTWVIRDGNPVNIDTKDIVVGDILILNNGDIVSADARITSNYNLEVDESSLTGEAIWVQKTNAIIDDVVLAERTNMVFSGSTIVKGRGTAIVTATGMDTELGHIAGLTESTREPKTPLQKSMKELSKSLLWIAVFFSIIIPVIGLFRGMPFQEMLLTGFSLAFATIPEELPIIITMTLGLSAIKLSKDGVLIKRVRAAETLGSVTVIATDKTGTLTENKMSIQKIDTDNQKLLLEISALMADIVENKEVITGDPMDIAVIKKAKEFDITKEKLLKEYNFIKDYGFDDVEKIFKSEYQYNEKEITVIKGAPESIIKLCKDSDKLTKRLNKLMEDGSRVIGVAYKENKEPKYIFVGFVCFEDPIRKDVADAVKLAEQAGIRTIMITGDHINTARKVAEQAGIKVQNVVSGNDLINVTEEELKAIVKTTNVFARITPEQKLNIVNALRSNNEVIAVTGDGINDAPALKSADIGIAMGIMGTDVAKESADMILTDDSFTSVIKGIKEGRKLYENLSKCIKYYLACKVGLVLSFLIPILIGIPMPFAPIQIILLELFMDLGASTSFVGEPMEKDIMRLKPRDTKEKFMNKNMILGIFSGGITLALTIMIVYIYLYYNGDPMFASTMAFVTWLIGHLVLAYNMRTNRVPLIKSPIFKNQSFNLWVGGIIVFIILIFNIDFLSQYLMLSSIQFIDVLKIIGISIIIMAWMEIKKIISSKS